MILKNRISPIVVSGFTDGTKFSYGNYDNWNLSSDRAIAVKSRMVWGGVNTARFARVEGYADTQMKNTEVPLAAANRRITILLLQDGEQDKMLPKYIYKQDELGIDGKQELKKAAEIKQAGTFDVNDYSKSGSKRDTPLSLEELKRKKAREAFRAKFPAGAPAAPEGGHGEAAAEPNETAPAPAAGHGGGH